MKLNQIIEEASYSDKLDSYIEKMEAKPSLTKKEQMKLQTAKDFRSQKRNKTNEKKKPPHVKASEPKPKKIKPTTGGSSPHPYRGRLVGEASLSEAISVSAVNLPSAVEQEVSKFLAKTDLDQSALNKLLSAIGLSLEIKGDRAVIDTLKKYTQEGGRHKPGIKVIITAGPLKGKTGRIGEIIRGPDGKPRSYVVDVEGNPQEPHVRLDRKHFKRAEKTMEDNGGKFQMKLDSASADDYMTKKTPKRKNRTHKELRKDLVRISDRYNVSVVDDYENYIFSKKKSKTDGAQSPFTKAPKK